MKLPRTLVKTFEIYCIYLTTFWAVLSTTTSAALISSELLQNQHNLVQDSMDKVISSLSPTSPQKTPSLSIGRMLSEVDLQGSRMILSKDQRTAFVVGQLASMILTIVDVSDPEFPIILSSYPISQQEGYYYIIPQAMILSDDETKLYISNADSLEIVDISNLRAPFKISIAKDVNAGKRTRETAIGQVYVAWPNIVISKDRQFLFASGLGLQVFNITKPNTPISISSVESPLYNRVLMPTSIALSPDGKKLFYTDGSLWIYDISDPLNLKIINSFNTSFPISSMRLSKDGKTAYLAGVNKKYMLLLQRISLSDKSLEITEDPIISINRDVDQHPVFLEQAPHDIFLFIKVSLDLNYKDPNVVVFDTREQRRISHEKFFSNNVYSLFFSEDYQRMFKIMPNAKLGIVSLYLDFPNKNSFSGSRNILQQFETKTKFTSMTFKNESFFYGISYNGTTRTLSTQKIDPESNELVSSILYQVNFSIKMTLSSDFTRAFLVINSNVASILDLSNNEILGEYRPPADEISFMKLSHFIASRDGKTGYKYENPLKGASSNAVHIVDLSDSAKPTKKASIQIDQDSGRLILSKDEKTIFVGGKSLSIYNLSDIQSPVLITNFPLSASGLSQGKTEMLLSHNEKIMFIKIERAVSPIVIQAIDLTNLASPRLLNELRFPSSQNQVDSFGMTLSPDSKTIYLIRENYLLAIEVSNPNSIRYAGAIILIEEHSDNYITDFKLNQDGTKAYIATAEGLVQIFAIQPAYSTFFLQDTLLLGERYNINLMMLEMNKNLDYNQMAENYKFTKFLFVEPFSMQTDFLVSRSPPSWISFDLKGRSLTVEARRKSDIKTYTTYLSFSKKIPENAFNNDEIELQLPTPDQDLFSTLISLGYLDNQLFLTENFGDFQDFYLPTTYSKLREEIFAVLKQYYFETFNELHIVQSLNLTTYGEKLRISTTNTAYVKVDISLKSAAAGGQFLSRHYGSLLPLITNNKSRIILEGSLGDVNLALKEIVLNLENPALCDAQITIDDNLNPVLTESITDISKYLNLNNKPRLSKTFPETIQHQVDRHVVETGQYFQVKLSQEIFDDDYTAVENLRYSVAFLKNDGSETELPDWLAFSDMTLSGTAPETVFNRDFELKISIKNEFQEFKESFTLRVKISSAFILKLLMRYSPYLLSILTLIISMNRIYNILGKSRYRHSKDVYLKPAEEVTSDNIFPIFLIAEEMSEANKILKYLKQEMTKELLMSYFTAKGGFDRQKFIQRIGECVYELPMDKKIPLQLYFHGSSSQNIAINQLVMNSLIMRLIRSGKEKETNVYFKKIKKDWALCVEWDSKNLFFKINDEKFENLIQFESTQNLFKTNEASLLKNQSSQVNIPLLKEAIFAYAFECQSLNQYPQDVIIQVKEKRDSGWLWEFLKMDLKDCTHYSGSGKIGYGIESKRKFSTIYFSGIVEEDFIYKQMVFQILNTKHKILKELWIYSADEYPSEEQSERGQSFYGLNEHEARGKEYEAF